MCMSTYTHTLTGIQKNHHYCWATPCFFCTMSLCNILHGIFNKIIAEILLLNEVSSLFKFHLKSEREIMSHRSTPSPFETNLAQFCCLRMKHNCSRIVVIRWDLFSSFCLSWTTEIKTKWKHANGNSNIVIRSSNLLSHTSENRALLFTDYI